MPMRFERRDDTPDIFEVHVEVTPPWSINTWPYPDPVMVGRRAFELDRPAAETTLHDPDTGTVVVGVGQPLPVEHEHLIPTDELQQQHRRRRRRNRG